MPSLFCLFEIRIYSHMEIYIIVVERKNSMVLHTV